MKTIFLAFCGLLFFGVDASPYLTSDSAITLDPACAKGQAYWCQDLASAKQCRATRHCIKAVWEKQEYPVDNDSICQICLDMVKQARDQLRSNETQEDLKAVFEGTCEFIRIKSIRKECDKLADDFVPELVEALSSQMNPQVVCSVSGLCNNAAIDRELAKHSKEMVVKKGPISPRKGLTCGQCNKVSAIISTKFANTNRDQVLENMLMMCGQMSSLSDGCSAIVLAYYNEVYDHLKENLNAENICHMAGVCADQFHQHEEDKIEIIEDSQIGFINREGDDIPCDLCKQLIMHLRDLLVANTTETEFKNVLEGICKQTKTFKQECLSLADQYYDEIYAKLTHDLDPDGACFMIGICPKGQLQHQQQHSYEIAPLVPSSQLLVKKKILGEDEPVFSAQQIQSFQLPKDVLFLNPDQIQANANQQKGNQFCTLCEYFLHFVQEALSSPANEEEIKDSILKMCDKVKKEFQPQCQSFVDQYSDAVIAMLIQEIDPSEVCPKLSLCTVRTPSTANEKCPLCLFLVQDLEDQLQQNKSKQNIEDKLHRLCDHLRDDLKAECLDFINTYTAELVDKMANDFSPRDICLYLKCCTEKEEVLIEKIGDKASYNDYLTNTVYQIEPEQSAPECLLCEELVKKVEKNIANDKSKDHIKKVLEEACDAFPKSKLKAKCLSAIEKNADFIIDLLVKEVTPKEVCMALGFCFAKNEFDEMVEIVPLEETKPSPSDKTCKFCEVLVEKIEKKLNNKTAQEDIIKCVEEVCDDMPKKFQPKCKKFIEAYANEIIKYLPNEPPKEVCKKACACPAADIELVDDYFPLPETKPSPSDKTCKFCEVLVGKIEKALNNKTAQEDIIKCVEQVCDDLPKKVQPKCKKFMEAYANEIIKYLPNEPPKEVCKKACACPAADIEQFDDYFPLPETKPSPSEYTCRFCEVVVEKIEKEVNNKTAQEEIIKCVEQVCDDLPKKVQPQCKKFIEAYANEIIKYLPNEPPKEVCKKACACPAVEDELPEEDLSGDDAAPECLICEQLVKDVEQKVKNDESREHIKEALEQACSKFRKQQLKEKCVEVVDKNADYIVDAIIKKATPKEICHGLGFCVSSPNEFDTKIMELTRQLMSKYTDTPQCVLCELIATKLEAELKTNKTQDEIEEAIRKICHAMPAKMSSKCQKFVEDYADLVIGLVATVPPKELCGELNFCRSNLNKDTSQRDVLECGVCYSTVDALSTVLEKHGPKEKEIVAETTCNLLPAKYHKECQELMHVYGVSLTTLIKREEKLSDICGMIGKCFSDGDNSMFVEIKGGIHESEESDESSESDESTESHKTQPKRPLLGADSDCTHGPGYWCSSEAAMKKCKAEKFCATRYNKAKTP